MSKGFVSEYEDQWLYEIPATLNALIHHLTREANGFLVYQKSSYIDSVTGKEVHEMSNGVAYYVNDENQWTMIG